MPLYQDQASSGSYLGGIRNVMSMWTPQVWGDQGMGVPLDSNGVWNGQVTPSMLQPFTTSDGYQMPTGNTYPGGAIPDLSNTGGYYGAGGGGFNSAAAGGGGPNLMMDTGQSSGIPGGGPDMYGGSMPPPANVAQTGVDPYDLPFSGGGPAQPGGGFITASGGDPVSYNYSPAPDGGTYVYDSNWNYVATMPGSGGFDPAAQAAMFGSQPPGGSTAPTSATPPATSAPASGDISYTNPYSTQTQAAPSTIGSGFYGGTTSFGSTSTGLYGGLEGGLSTGSVGGFSGMMDSGLGGGMGPPNVMRYL